MSDDRPSGGLPPDILEAISKLAPYLREAGTALPKEVESRVPQIQLGDRVGEIAHALAQHLRGSGLYRAGVELVTVDEGTGHFQVMHATRFVSWADEWVSFWKPTRDGDKRFMSISKTRADEILCSDAFRCKIPNINGINPVKLPVRRRDGSLELLQPGYDPESGIFTLRNGIDYDENWEVERARSYILNLLRYFPFGDESRSLAVHVAAMLTPFAMGLLPAGARPPMFIWNANQVGSGKTRLAQMPLIAVHGAAAVSTWWPEPAELKKELDSAAQSFAPYLFFDDQSGKLRSNLINTFVTASQWSGRVMGTKERFHVPLRAVTFVTGNQLRYSDDIFRRSLISDLFSPVQYDRRQLPPDAIDLTEEWLMAEQNRNDILASLWALVRHAETAEMQTRAKVSRTIGSFEAWSRAIPRIVIHAGIGDPTEMATEVQGNPDLKDARDLARLALDELVQGRPVHSVRLSELIPIARRAGLFPEKIGTLEESYRELDSGRGKWKQIEVCEDTLIGKTYGRRDPSEEEKWAQAAMWADRKMSTTFGSALKRLMNGLQFSDSKGRTYQFGSREGSRTATYLCTLLK